MRFKSVMTKENAIFFSNSISLLEKIANQAVIFINQEKIKLCAQMGGDGIMSYIELMADQVFHDMKIESLSANSILFEIQLQNLSRALSSCKGGNMCEVKLAKRKKIPCMCFSTKTMDIEVELEIPIKIMKVDDLENYTPPEVPSPTVQLELPIYQRAMRLVVERLGRTSKYVYIEGEMNGSITIQANQDTNTTKTFFTGLKARFEGMEESETTNTSEEEEEERDGGGGRERLMNNSCVLKTETKRLITMLQCQTIPIDNCILCFCRGTCLVLHVFLSPRGSGTLTHYIPINVMEEGEYFSSSSNSSHNSSSSFDPSYSSHNTNLQTIKNQALAQQFNQQLDQERDQKTNHDQHNNNKEEEEEEEEEERSLPEVNQIMLNEKDEKNEEMGDQFNHQEEEEEEEEEEELTQPIDHRNHQQQPSQSSSKDQTMKSTKHGKNSWLEDEDDEESESLVF